MKMRKLAAIGLAVMMLGTTVVQATDVNEAGQVGNSQIELQAEGVQFKATVPIKFPFNLDATGAVTVADNLYIHNMSAAPIEVTKALVELGSTDWNLHDFTKDSIEYYANMRVNTTGYGFNLNGTPAVATVDAEGNPLLDELSNPISTSEIDVTNTAEGTWAIIGSAGFDAVADEAGETNILKLNYEGKFAPQSAARENLIIGTVQFTLNFDDNGLVGQ